MGLAGACKPPRAGLGGQRQNVSDTKRLAQRNLQHPVAAGPKNPSTPAEARKGLALLRAHVEPTPTASLGLHDVALELGLAINHSTYDTL
jgi:hypothetical protein